MRKSTVRRQSTTDRDALWDMFIRVPLGYRFSHASAALTWGCLQETNVHDESILLSDCHPKSQEAYDAFAPKGKKYEARGKQPEPIDLFARCDKRRIGIWRFLYGRDPIEERIHAMMTLKRLHEAHPDLFALPTIGGAWGEMSFR